ncbi:TadE/TadG family type IV pilus assembly protein [Collinsella sp. D33t1_170424_A12]|uniref:TadE/TadG family type IV pilus assembly protein n=1 Tax=Collinsella sp. D33t1_170424_A12 TaxID=2787135 RepID=UPI00351C0E67
MLVERGAQATVEAAILLPSFCIVVLLALQPVCVRYTQAVMEVAAAQGCRLVATGEGADERSTRAFILRRLAAVPDIAIFHAGGPLAWEVDYGGEGEAGRFVEIEGWVKPLPVLGVFVGAFGERNAAGDVRLRVRAAMRPRPAWVKGDYDAWIQE